MAFLSCSWLTDSPGMPDMPGMPDAAGMPAMPGMPEATRMPGMPDAPAIHTSTFSLSAPFVLMR